MSNPQKRKRTVVSYAQLDPLADLLSDDEDVTMVSCHESSDDESENDDRTYSRRRVCFGHGQKQATVRLIKPENPQEDHEAQEGEAHPYSPATRAEAFPIHGVTARTSGYDL